MPRSKGRPVISSIGSIPEPIPGIGALLGGATPLDLAILFADDPAEAQEMIEPAEDFLNAVAQLASLSGKINAIASVGYVDLGSFSLSNLLDNSGNKINLRDPDSAERMANLKDIAAGNIKAAKQPTPQGVTDLQNAVKTIPGEGFKFRTQDDFRPHHGAERPVVHLRHAWL